MEKVSSNGILSFGMFPKVDTKDNHWIAKLSLTAIHDSGGIELYSYNNKSSEAVMVSELFAYRIKLVTSAQYKVFIAMPLALM